jgi:hypothetical protein
MRRRRMNPFTARPNHLRQHFADVNSGGTIDGDAPQEGTDDFDPKAFASTTATTIANLQKEIANSKKAAANDIKALKDTVSTLAETLKTFAPQAGGTQEGDGGGEEGAEVDPPPTTRRGRRPQAGGGGAEPPPDAASPELSELKKQMQTLTKQLEAERKRGDTAEERRLAAESRQRNAERDRLLIAASTDANAISATDAADFLRTRASYDEDLETWGIRDGDDFLSIEEGVSKFLPRYMLKARNTTGGAGGHGTGADNGVNRATLRQNAIQAGIAARKNPGNVGRYSRAKSDFESAGGDITEIINEVASAVI